MARIFNLRRKSTLALRQRKRWLLSQCEVPPNLLRASFVQRFSVCGKANCRCHHGGAKHGPFYYLTQSLAVGQINKFLLKEPAQQKATQEGVAQWRKLQEQLEEISQINSELLRRREALNPA